MVSLAFHCYFIANWPPKEVLVIVYNVSRSCPLGCFFCIVCNMCLPFWLCRLKWWLVCCYSYKIAILVVWHDAHLATLVLLHRGVSFISSLVAICLVRFNPGHSTPDTANALSSSSAFRNDVMACLRYKLTNYFQAYVFISIQECRSPSSQPLLFTSSYLPHCAA